MFTEAWDFFIPSGNFFVELRKCFQGLGLFLRPQKIFWVSPGNVFKGLELVHVFRIFVKA